MYLPELPPLHLPQPLALPPDRSRIFKCEASCTFGALTILVHTVQLLWGISVKANNSDLGG